MTPEVKALLERVADAERSIDSIRKAASEVDAEERHVDGIAAAVRALPDAARAAIVELAAILGDVEAPTYERLAAVGEQADMIESACREAIRAQRFVRSPTPDMRTARERVRDDRADVQLEQARDDEHERAAE